MMPVQETTIEVNRDSAPQVCRVGNERTPVIVIDDFAVDTSEIIDYACTGAEFRKDTTAAYPGVRAALPRGHVISELNVLYPLLCSVYSVPSQLTMRPINAVYSIVSTPEPELKLLQCLPHFDSNKPYYFAITHYLGTGDYGGTGLYRHKPTGYESVTEDRLESYIEAGDAHLAAHGDPRQGYFGDSDDHYELYERIEYKPNRLVAYPGYLLHSGLVDPARDVNANPATGRLTSNVFVNFQ